MRLHANQPGAFIWLLYFCDLVGMMTDRELLQVMWAQLQKRDADVTFYQQQLRKAEATISKLEHDLQTATFLQSRWGVTRFASASLFPDSADSTPMC